MDRNDRTLDDAYSGSAKSRKNRKNRKIKAGKGDTASGEGGQTNHNNNNGGGKTKSNGNRRRYGHQNSRGNKILYPDYRPLKECLHRYCTKDKKIARGKLRTNAGGGTSFVTCDRGGFVKDLLLDGEMSRNRALDGDIVFVEIIGSVDNHNVIENGTEARKEEFLEKTVIDHSMENLALEEEDNGSNVAIDDDGKGMHSTAEENRRKTWQDDEEHRILWDPIVPIFKRKKRVEALNEEQFLCKVIHIIPPISSGGKVPSEINPIEHESGSQNTSPKAKRTIVGTLKSHNNLCLFIPNSRSLPRFLCPASIKPALHNDRRLYKADYVYGSWSATAKWAPCINVKAMGQSCNIEDETNALLIENNVNHGDFEASVLKDVEDAVHSGRLTIDEDDSTPYDLGWAPTPDMYKGRRDYRKERIFTIDPTTAKDLDDALHIRPLKDGKVEIGVHIADVSHFVTPESDVDNEAARRTTTVYLVDRVIPMLPRPLCEIACSLNENVERLAFSCVWTMNMDGTLVKRKTKNGSNKKSENDVWYGRTVIKSCARLDYATAQNIINGKVATGEMTSDIDEKYWPKSRQPTGCHTIDDVAHDVRLMHKVAMARRKLRFENGALALNGIKLAFQMEDDGETPSLCSPYPIRDSNRLIEEYMLLANYLVAQRLITHAGGLAVLRQHAPPLNKGLQNVINLAEEKGFEIDGSTSKTLQQSLSAMSRNCDDDVVMQCVTEMLMTPMRPAEYIAAGEYDPEDYTHFALNIPYYTHFTSPIRRYPDILVHRLLQATLDGQEAVDEYSQRQTQEDIQSICTHCNEKRLSSKRAQERSDRVFLSLFLKAKPIKSTLGIVVSIGEKAFTVFVPLVGISALVYLDKNSDSFDARVLSDDAMKKRSMILISKNGGPNINIKIFAKISVACYCKEEPPIDVTLKPVGPWTE